jgi:cytolysin-activating lysine-acyltransferase
MAKAVKGETKTVATKVNANGSGDNANGSFDVQVEASNPQLDPDILKRVAAVRSHVRESFGKITMAMMMLPRYRSQTLADLQHLVLEPLIRDRVAIAYPGETEQSDMADISGVAIWASVSDAVDLSIREQIKAGVFPVRLKAEDWTSGEINWLLDIIAPDKKTTASVIANFKQLVKEGSLRLHPLITRLVDEETLKKMGAEKMASPAS